MTSFQTQSVATAKSFGTAWRHYIREMWHQRIWTIPGLILPGVGNILALYVPPLIIANMIRHFDGRIPSTWDEIVPYIAMLAGAWILGELLWRIATLLLNVGDTRGMNSLYRTALHELLKKDVAFFNDNFAGSLTKKALGYGRGFESFVDTISFNILAGLLPLIFASVILWSISPWLVLALVGITLLTMAAIYPSIRKRQRLVAAREAASNTMAGHIADVISNIVTVQAFAHESDEQKRHDGFVTHYTDTSRRAWDYHVLRIDMKIAPLLVISNVTGLVLAILLTENATAFAAVFISFNYFMQATRILFEFNRIYRNIENSLTEAAEFTALLEQEASLQEVTDARELKAGKGNIVFKDVDFAYDDNAAQLLFERFNLDIKPGEKIAFVGHSGGGKTTITKLLLRFVDINAGTVSIDGQDISKATLASLRRSIAYVPQDPAMFHRTIAENIRYGRPDATEADIQLAARRAHATEFVDQLPEGFETMVGERGVKLSGGQRQRIAIARAMLKNAPILVLDEATSALDSESEVLIQDALWKLMEGRTAIIIAHRLSTIQKVDRIIVLDKGRIAEQGSHKQLLKHKGIYAKLWAHQSGGFIED